MFLAPTSSGRKKAHGSQPWAPGIYRLMSVRLSEFNKEKYHYA